MLHEAVGEAGAGDRGRKPAGISLHDGPNRCLDTLRKKGLQTESLYPNDTYGIIDDDDAAERSQTEAKLWTAIDSLPEKCREVFILSKRDGLKYEEIAEELGLSVNTVRNQISKALKILKEGARKILMFFFA